MKIVADGQIPRVGQAFSCIGDVILADGFEIGPRDILDADILVVRTVTRVDAGLLSGSRVRFVASATSGTDHVDLDFLQRTGIGFAYAPGCNARSVVEYVLSSLAMLAVQHGFRLRDKTAGIIGCGAIGSRLLKALGRIGVNCLVNDPPLRDSTGDVIYRDLDDVLGAADIISLHVPLTASGRYPTRHLVNEKFLSRMRPGAILINTSRGGVVDEKSLNCFLDGENGLTVVADVWENEPDIDAGLLAVVAVGTPHIAGYSTDGRLRATETVYRETCRFFDIAPAWSDPGGIYDMGRNSFRIADEVSDDDAVLLAILSHYDVRSDGAALRRLIEISRDQARRYFNELRQNYPLRREFPATTICIPPHRDRLAAILRGLGFNVRAA